MLGSCCFILFFVYSSMSGIDYIFGRAPLVAFMWHTRIHDIVMSDHALVEVNLSDSTLRPQARIWRLTVYLISEETFKQTIIQVWEEYFEYNAQHRSNPNLFWETGKSFLRGRIISYAKAQKKHTRDWYIAAGKALWEAVHWIPDHKSQRTLERQTWLDKLEHTWADHIALKYHKHAHKAGKLLVQLVQGEFRPVHIAKMRTETVEVCSSLTRSVAIIRACTRTAHMTTHRLHSLWLIHGSLLWYLNSCRPLIGPLAQKR